MINTAPYIIDFFNAVVWASDDGTRKSEIAAAHLKQGKWNSGAMNHYYHGQFEKNIPIAIYDGPYEIDEILVEGNWRTQ